MLNHMKFPSIGSGSPRWRELVIQAWKAVLFGIALGLLITAISREFRNLVNYVIVSCLCTLVIGLGFHVLPKDLLAPPKGRSPAVAAGIMQVKWLGICGALLTLSLGLLRIVYGPRVFGSPISIVIICLIGLLITSLAVGQATATTLVASSRSLEQARARAGFLALQAQLQPHTLFNALNTILALIRRSPDDAEAATRNLAHLLRRTTTALEQESWPLREEFKLLEALLDLECLRFGDRLHVVLDLPGEVEDLMIPPLLLVPLVENSLKHGFRSKVGPCSLSVRIEGRTLRVVDDGVGSAQPMAEGVGLRTVRERLEAIGGSLSWPRTGSGCIVQVEFP